MQVLRIKGASHSWAGLGVERQNQSRPYPTPSREGDGGYLRSPQAVQYITYADLELTSVLDGQSFSPS
jgi:hypothetical protein